MLNYYPLWKYIMLLITLVIGLLYALPNLYGEDFAIQITGNRGNTISQSTLVDIQNTLQKQYIKNKSITINHKTILLRFFSADMQLRAKEILIKHFNKNYIIALNLAPATPDWLVMLGAKPIKLGLDLRGGIHFLIEVDIDTVFKKLQEQTIDILRNDLQEKQIPYERVIQGENYSSTIRFYNTYTRNQAISWLTPRYRNLVIETLENNTLIAKLNNDYLHAAREYAVQKNIMILRNRVNQLGVSEPLVQRQGNNRIAIELPGIQDMTQAKDILGATSSLEFHLINTDKINDNKNRLPEDSEIQVTRNGESVALYKRVILTGDYITDATTSNDEYHRPQVNISLNKSGGEIMSNFSKNNIGKLLATLFIEYKHSGNKDTNGHSILEKQKEIINIAIIQSRLDNNFRITGIKNTHEAHKLSLLLRAGALIAPIQIIEERSIGPTLGVKNITQGIKACIWGLVASIVFIITYYKKFGVIATTALIANLVFIIGIMSLLPGATLTMPGIAGIVLTLAVAIDANVLINERIKEELNNSRTVQQAINEGYRSAQSSIIDSNVTTLITAIILYALGTGSIKGFAITTAIGSTTSMFTAIIGTRAIVNLLYGGKRIDKLSI